MGINGLLNINSSAYNVIANRSSKAIANIKAELESQPDIKPYLNKL